MSQQTTTETMPDDVKIPDGAEQLADGRTRLYYRAGFFEEGAEGKGQGEPAYEMSSVLLDNGIEIAVTDRGPDLVLGQLECAGHAAPRQHGAGADALARFLAAGPLRSELGTEVIVENRAGAGGTARIRAASPGRRGRPAGRPSPRSRSRAASTSRASCAWRKR